VIAIGLPWRADRFLVTEVRDDAGALKGVRPLGGGVKFGETWQTALLREFKEELGIAVAICTPPIVLENIYRHEGHTGHEIVFAAGIRLPDSALPGSAPITFHEDDGAPCVARWFSPSALEQCGVPLFPDGLAERIEETR